MSRLGQDFAGPIDVGRVDVEVRDGPHVRGVDGQHQQAALLQKRENSPAVPSRGSTRKITMFVSICAGHSDRPSIWRIASAKRLGVGVVFGQALDVMLQGVERRGGDDAGLPHAAAEQFAMPPGLA